MGLGMGMGMNHWEWEGMGLKKILPLISSPKGNPRLRQLKHAKQTGACGMAYRRTKRNAPDGMTAKVVHGHRHYTRVVNSMTFALISVAAPP